MSVFLPKRVKVGSQTDAYWGILSLCLYSYFLIQPHDWGRCNIIIYSTGFIASHRVTGWIFNVLFLIIRMSVICLQSRQGLRVCALYLTKIDVNKINLIQNKTEIYHWIKYRYSPHPHLRLLISCPLIFSSPCPQSFIHCILSVLHVTICALFEQTKTNHSRNAKLWV